MTVTFIGFRVDEEPIPTGEPVDIEYTVVNFGSEPETYSFPVSVEDTQSVSTVTVDTQPNVTHTGEVTVTFDKPGVYEVRMDDTTQNLVVGDSSEIYAVTDIGTDSESYTIGDEVTVNVTVRNTDDTMYDAEIPVAIDGETVRTDTVTIPPNGTEHYTTFVTPENTGTVDLSCGGASTTITVTPVPKNIVSRSIDTENKTVTLQVAVGTACDRVALTELFEPELGSVSLQSLSVTTDGASRELVFQHEGAIIAAYSDVPNGTTINAEYSYETADSTDHSVTATVDTSSRTETVVYGETTLR